MTQSMAEFIHRENVANFVGRLLGVMNDEQRETITALLADERAKAKAAGWDPC